MLKDKG